MPVRDSMAPLGGKLRRNVFVRPVSSKINECVSRCVLVLGRWEALQEKSAVSNGTSKIHSSMDFIFSLSILVILAVSSQL